MWLKVGKRSAAKTLVLNTVTNAPADVIQTFAMGDKSLLYFTGSQGDVIDALQGHFIPNSDY